MDKSRVCINQATRLAKQKCVKKTNLLVYEKKRDPCSDDLANWGYVIPPIACMPPKRIRGCTEAELKKMCPPKLCACPPKRKSLGFFWFLMGLVGFGFKVVIAGGMVYWTYSIGLWGDSKQTEQIYISFCERFGPEAAKRRKKKKKISEVCEAEIGLMCEEPEIPTIGSDPCAKSPSTEQTVYKFKEKWNSAMVTVFDVLEHFPSYLTAFYQKAKDDVEAKKEARKQKKET